MLAPLQRDGARRARSARRSHGILSRGIVARGIVAFLGLALLGGVLSAGPPVAHAAPSGDPAPATDAASAPSVSADPLPTAQIDGIVWAQAVASGLVYAGGQFASARPAGAPVGTSEAPRSNLMAYELATGALVPTFAPNVNGRVLAMAASPDGARLYVAGAFTLVDGVNRYRVAAFDTATGRLVATWAVGTNSTVYGIAATATTVYLAGQFTSVNNTARTGIAAVAATTGALLPFNPVVTGGYCARAVVVSPDETKVIVAGSFLTTNGQSNPGRGMAALDARTGASLPWDINSTIRNAGTNSAIYSLAADATSVYGSGYDFGGTKTEDDFEGTFRASWADGAMVWMEDCHGDTYSVAPLRGNLYTAAHTHYCGNIGEFPQLNPWHVNHSLAFAAEPSGRAITPDIYGYRSFTGKPAAKLLHWFPIWGTGQVSGIDQAGWSVIASGDYVLYGGEFTSIDNVRQQGLVRFAVREAAPNRSGPVTQGGAWPLAARAMLPTEVRLSWRANFDPDDRALTYAVQRRGTATPLSAETLESSFWDRPHMRFIDRAVQPGATYEYRIRATDPSGNATQTDWASVTVPAAGQVPAYVGAVLADAPAHYWPLDEASGTVGADWAGTDDLVVTANATRGVPGQETDGSSASTSFTGSTSFASTQSQLSPPDELSIEAWFQTTSTRGGKIVGFGDQSTGLSKSYDRHVYLTSDGRVTFGVFPGQVRVVQSAAGFNDGAWHHVVGTLGANGMTLFIDGIRVGTRADTVSAQDYAGVWRVGGDNLSSWPNVTSNDLAGRIADVAVYDTVLTRAQIDAHRVASGRTAAIAAPPADAYGAAVRALDPSLYWRLGEPSGTVANDTGFDGVVGSYQSVGTRSIVRGVPGALAGVADTAVTFTSARSVFQTWTDRQMVTAARAVPGPATYAIETWFRTTSTTGGRLVGFGNSNATGTNASSQVDRLLMTTPSGAVSFGTAGGQLTSPGTYRDGAWHHVVAQQSASGMQLYVDGAIVAASGATQSSTFSGYWRLAGDTTWTGDPFWVGSLDEVAIYPQPLTPAQIQAHVETATTGGQNQPPVAAFSAERTGLSIAFDGSASSDPDGSIVAWAWDFGDGATGDGATTTHEYTTAGTFTASLTVTDERGASSTRHAAVTAGSPMPPGAIAFDTFSRTTSNGWGAADLGGSWATSGGNAAFATTGDAGTISLAPSSTREARLGVVAPGTVVDVAFSSSVAAAGGTVSVTVIARQAGASVYSARVRLEPTGLVRLYLLRDETALGGQCVVLPQSYVPGQILHVRVSAVGAGPTTLAASVWRDGDAMPATPLLQASDATAALQAPGTIGIRVAVSAASTNPTTVVRFDDLAVVPQP